MGRDARVGDRAVAALGEHRAELAEVVVRVLRQHLVSAASPAADDSGLPLNVPCCAAPFVTHSM